MCTYPPGWTYEQEAVMRVKTESTMNNQAIMKNILMLVCLCLFALSGSARAALNSKTIIEESDTVVVQTIDGDEIVLEGWEIDSLTQYLGEEEVVMVLETIDGERIEYIKMDFINPFEQEEFEKFPLDDN